jgi:signal transduction histidine kinase
MKPFKSKVRWRALQDRPVIVKVMGIAAGMTLLMCAGFLLPVLKSYQQLETEEVNEHARFVAQALAIAATPLLQNGALTELQTLLDEKIHLRPAIGTSIISLEVLNATGQVVVRTVSKPAVQRRGRTIHAYAPLPGESLGSIHVALDEARIEYELSWHTRRVMVTTVIIVILVVGAAWWLMKLAIRPIHELVFSAKAVQEGRYDLRAPVRTNDEVGKLAVAFNRMTATLQEKDRLNGHLLRKVIAASEDERKRVARELHDHTGQALTSLIVSLTPLKSPASVAELRAVAVEALEEVHDLCLILRPSALDDLGLMAALDHHARRFSRLNGVEVRCWATGLDSDTRLPAEVEVALYRIVQEALTNAVRHGQARSIKVLIQCKEESVLTVIEDDGQGFPAKDWRAHCLNNDRLGLLGIEERARLLSGQLRVESQPGIGARLFVEIPLPKDWECGKSNPDCG